jgi:hypothetical protein
MGQDGRTFNQRYAEQYQDLKTRDSWSNFARHLIEKDISLDLIQNIIKVVHLICKGNHINNLAKYYIHTETKCDNQYWFQTFAVLWMLYSVFCITLRRPYFMCRRFGTLYVLSEFYVPTFQNTLIHLNLICRRFAILYSIWILYADVSEHSVPSS